MTTPVSTQQVLTQAVVGVMTVSIVASAMGIMMGAIGAEAYKVPPGELKASQEAIRDLRLAFGGNVVDRAVKNVGSDNALALAQEVERLTIADMNSKYGTQATQAALAAAPPGDVAAAKMIAETLASRGVRPSAFQAAIGTPTGVQIVQQVKKKRVKMAAKPVLDTKTNVRYKSKSAAGMAVAHEYPGLDPTNTFVWYEVIKKDPSRFKEV